MPWRPGGWQQEDPFLGDGERQDVMATAVIRAATQATSLPNLPAVRDLK